MRRRLASLLAMGALLSSMLIVTGGIALAANQAADLDQCANGAAPSLPTNGCDGSAGTQWVNGNLGESKSIYREGDSIPYRLKLTNIVTGSTVHTVVIEWDTTKSGKHAIDYLTTWDRTVSTANPCFGVAGCNLAAPTSIVPIPKDPQVDPGTPPGSGAIGGQPAGNLTMWGGTITSISAYSYANGTGFAGDKSASIAISFTASAANPVLAWGGHIATRQAWGALNSAVSISGSPYHTRLLSLDGSGGNQDRSLSAAAVIFPARITVIKNADGPGATFTFNGTDFTPNPFTLTDGAASANPSKVSNEILTFGSHTVSEVNPLPGYKLDTIVCSSDMTNNYVPTIAAGGAGGSVNITLEEGEDVTCTFNNLAQLSTMTINKTVVSVGTDTEAPFSVTAAGQVISYSILVTNTGNTTLTSVSVSDPRIAGNLDCAAAEGQQTTGFSLAPGGTLTCTGSYTVLQSDLNDNGGGDGDIDNTATANSTQVGPITDSEAVPVAPAPSLSITKVDDYDGDAKFENVGDVITYTIVVTNTGNTDLVNVNVTDVQAPNLDCNPDALGNQTSGFTIPVGGSLTCSASHTIVQADLDAGSFFNQACADDGSGDGDTGADAKCDDVTTPGKSQPTITTADVLIPQDAITISGLTADATGELYVELRINAECGAAAAPAYSKTWSSEYPEEGDALFNGNNGGNPYTTNNTVAVSSDATIRWCTSYSGDANNAERPLDDRGEVVSVDFDPTLTGAAIGFAIPLLAWALWRRRQAVAI